MTSQALTQEFELPPLWAVHDENGDILTTLDKAGDGSYWAYKHGIKNYSVRPYPDEGRLMLQLTTDCNSCDGTGWEKGAIQMAPVDPEGWTITAQLGYDIDPNREPDEVTDCYKCHGYGYMKKSGYDGFKTEATFKRAMNAGTAKKCNVCEGHGKTRYVPVFRDCYSCKGRGKRPTWDATRPILPPEVSDCDNATPEFMQGWLETITITVRRDRNTLSWGEAHLGLAGFGSCVDYGRTWNSDDDTIIDEVVEHISRGEQYIKFMDRRTRIFSPALIIDVTPNGYSMIPANVPTRFGALPPTYFPRVFEDM